MQYFGFERNLWHCICFLAFLGFNCSFVALICRTLRFLSSCVLCFRLFHHTGLIMKIQIVMFCDFLFIMAKYYNLCSCIFVSSGAFCQIKCADVVIWLH